VALTLIAPLVAGETSLQGLVDAALPGSTLRPPPGRYTGAVVIAKPLTIDGGGTVTLDGGGHGTVVTIRAPGVTVRGLRIANSGDSHDGMDAGVLVEADDAIVEHNAISSVLFGVHLRQSNGTIVRRNTVNGHPAPLGLRGDGLRLWNSRRNRIEDNELSAMRDVTLANSPDNRLAGNTIRDGRYGMHLVFSPGNVIEGNRLSGNSTGIAVLYSDNVTIRGNTIHDSHGTAGAGLAFKESSDVLVEGNEVVHCTVAVQANSPIHPANIIRFRDNRFAHNVTGMYFYGEKGGHIVRGNRFEKNLLNVAVSAAASARDNDWHGNLWDDYEGFDRDGDGIGDTPYELWAFADRIWMETPMARFFRNSPLFELLDLLERLAPFSSPELILRDPRPVLQRERRLSAADQGGS
jgi:nitrous oxidase accessory protein